MSESGRAPRQRRQSREPNCPRKSSLPGIPETACSARDPCPQRSASSDPPANHIARISQTRRFHTARVIRYRFGARRKSLYVRNAPKADAKSGYWHLSRCARDGLMHRSISFDHLVGGGEQRGRNGEAESLGGLEVDHKFKLVGC